MITRNLTIDDSEKVFDSFKSVSISSTQQNAPDYGFYEYPLTRENIASRLYNPKLSIALEDGKNKSLAAYILAYPFEMINDLDKEHDAVLASIRAPREVIYLDQLFLRPGLPLFLTGRLLDTWTQLAQGYTNEGVITAIPQTPWKNIPSTRFAIARGFSRRGSVKSGNLELGVFAKPFWQLGDAIRDIILKITPSN